MKKRDLEDIICVACDVDCGINYCNAFYMVLKFADMLDADKLREVIEEK